MRLAPRLPPGFAAIAEPGSRTAPARSAIMRMRSIGAAWATPGSAREHRRIEDPRPMANTPWGQPPDIVAFTGAGLSRESGFAPFDAGAMPAGLRLEDVVTPEGFARDPARVLDFYNLRRRQLLEAKPNAAHDGLAVLDAVRKREVLLVTRNIDDFHERAGSQAVIHTHGELLKARCT